VDEIVARSLAKWPNVPAVYGWLELDRRGNWLIKGERIGNPALREFIGRNYEADERGRWFFQNGPQRVYVRLAYTPFVMHYEGERLFDQCGRPVEAIETFLDDEGSSVTPSWRTDCRASLAKTSQTASRSSPTPEFDRGNRCAGVVSSL